METEIWNLMFDGILLILFGFYFSDLEFIQSSQSQGEETSPKLIYHPDKSSNTGNKNQRL